METKVDEPQQEIVKAEPQAIQRIEIPADAPLMTRLAMMMEAGIKIDIVLLEGLAKLNRENKADLAREAFNVALAAFKSEVPQISKNRTVGYTAKGQHVGYKHVTLDLITNTINPFLSKHGLSTTWDTENLQDGSIKVTCELAHEMGHFKKVSLAEKKDTTGSKNSIQSGGSTITYLKRYTLECVTGITAVDDDDDGAGAGNNTQEAPAFKPLTPADIAVIDAICAKIEPAGPGFVINKKRIGALLIEHNRAKLIMANVAKGAAWVMTHGDHDLYEPIKLDDEKPGKFE